MQKFIISGGTKLIGSVRVSGAKNASYKLMIASLLSDKESRILNLPDINDVQMTSEIIRSLGGLAESRGEKNLFISSKHIKKFQIDKIYGEKSRSSTIFIPFLLHKFKKALVPLPGGDKIGKRPLERHFEGLKKMGAVVNFKEGFLEISANKLNGVEYKFEKNTHTGTETLIMAAVLANGQTILKNAAEEPEIDDLILLLNRMGANIKRRAFRTIEINGVSKLHGAIHKVMPDRNETVTYACAALVTKGDVIVENARHQDIEAFLKKLDEIGAGYEISDYGIRFFYKGELVNSDITTQIHPGFMTDWQPLIATLLCHCPGESVIHETVMQSRFQYVEPLNKMGAKITTFNPKIKNIEEIYNFNPEDYSKNDQHAIKIVGPSQFQGGEFEIADLRAGATIMLAALSGFGETILTNIEQIDRGYENLDKKLIRLGAKIKRV
jgi:UDP-N-acetylglucosamine 1-carboxyvinyltransferase